MRPVWDYQKKKKKNSLKHTEDNKLDKAVYFNLEQIVYVSKA